MFELAATGAADGFLFCDATFFGAGNIPAFPADGAEYATLGNDFAEAAEELLLRFVRA